MKFIVSPIVSAFFSRRWHFSRETVRLTSMLVVSFDSTLKLHSKMAPHLASTSRIIPNCFTSCKSQFGKTAASVSPGGGQIRPADRLHSKPVLLLLTVRAGHHQTWRSRRSCRRCKPTAHSPSINQIPT